MAAQDPARAVSLREVTADTVRAICKLEVAPAQRGLVAPNAVSIAQAHFEPAAWFRGIYAGDEPALLRPVGAVGEQPRQHLEAGDDAGA